MWASIIAKQFSHPTRTVAGWVIGWYLKLRNQAVAQDAMQLVGIQPKDTVLELGHGPGVVMQSAVKLLTEPTGCLIGVDYSSYMHQTASKRMKELVASGKVTLHLCDVAAMPLADNTVDKVYHTNCFYYWPDLRKAATEIHRVMKPGGLMVTTMWLKRVTTLAAQGVVPGENWRPEAYMTAVRDSGFTDIRMIERQHEHLNFIAIFATASKKV